MRLGKRIAEELWAFFWELTDQTLFGRISGKLPGPASVDGRAGILFIRYEVRNKKKQNT